ncbi:hypothetical protein MACK_001659 [Theileria orientalis]|uniref:RAP domain-containing protein n=1 Tax=Theileria orientalis TaxID=68886 RepID=A0A976MCV6_THEOR|nr:hypothetical protein MACK_001659 [Theileria orientalis]
MNIAVDFRNAVKYIKYYTRRYYSSYRITRIPIEHKNPLNFKLLNEKLLELHEIESASRSRILETYEAISNSDVKSVLDDFYYTQLVKKTSNLSLSLIPEDYAKIFNSFRGFPRPNGDCVHNLNLGVQRLSKNFTTKQIALILRSYAHIKSRSLKTISELVETFNKKFEESEPWEQREVASALSSLNVPNQGPINQFYDRTVSNLPKHMKSMDANHIAIFVNSFCSRGVAHNEILHFIDMNHKSIMKGIDAKNLSLIVNSFARNNKLSENLMNAVSNKLSKAIEENRQSEFYEKMNVIDISLIFNAFVKLEHYDLKLMNKYIPWLLDKIDNETKTLSLVLLVHSYAQSGIKSNDLFSKIAHILVYRVSQLNPQKLGLVSISYAKVGYVPPILFNRIADEIIYRGTIGLKYSRYEFDFKSLEQITQAFSRIGYKDRRIFSVLTTLLKSRFKNNKEVMNGEMIASLMVSISRNKTEEFVPFITEVLEKIDDTTTFSTMAISKVLTSFNKLGIKNSRLTRRFLNETSNRVNQFTPSALINAFKALAKMKCYDAHLVKETLKRCAIHLTNLSTIDMANLVRSLSDLSYRNVTFLKKLSVCINYNLNNLTKHQLHIIFNGLALLRVSDTDLMFKLVEKISAYQHEFNEVERAEIAMGIVYTITHLECLNKEIGKMSAILSTSTEPERELYVIPDHLYNTLDHMLVLLDQKLDVATIFKLKTIHLYLKNMKPEKYKRMSKKAVEILEKANSVEFSLAEYILTSSSNHKQISYYLNMMGIVHKNEVQFGPYLIDVVPESKEKIAIEYDGPSHFYTETLMRNIKSILKHEILTSAGWKMVHIPYQEWAQLVDEKQKIVYLNRIRLELVNIDGIKWEKNTCFF